MKEKGKHSYSGSCSPGGRNCWDSQKTFSLGIFEWVETSNGKGLKKSKVKVRVSGSVFRPEDAIAKALEIIDELDKGEYVGPKNVKVK